MKPDWSTTNVENKNVTERYCTAQYRTGTFLFDKLFAHAQRKNKTAADLSKTQ